MLKRTLIAVLWIFILNGFGFAQGGPPAGYSIRGYIIVPAINHIENFEILLTPRGSEEIISRTNAGISGDYAFTNLGDGYYDVIVRLDGFKEKRESISIGQENRLGVTVSMTRSYDLNIFMTPNDTEVVLDERLRGYPKEAISEYTFAVDASNSMHYDQVVAHLEKVVKLAADWFDAHCDLGVAYEQVHRTGDAEREYRAALDLKPDGFRPQFNLGRMLMEDADNKIQSAAPHDAVNAILGRAHEALAAAVMRDPMSAMASYMLGAVDFRLADYKDAAVELQQALELDATIYPARITLINVFVEQKQWQDALDNVDAFLLENPSSPYRQQVAATRISVVRRLQSSR